MFNKTERGLYNELKSGLSNNAQDKTEKVTVFSAQSRPLDQVLTSMSPACLSTFCGVPSCQAAASACTRLQARLGAKLGCVTSCIVACERVGACNLAMAGPSHPCTPARLRV
eukprot:1158566-Pleurochrysis_carterae.AAC.3